MNDSSHHRRSHHLADFDYTQAGFYFVTIVTYQRENNFGSISEGIVNLSRAGLVAQMEWLHLAERFPFVTLDEFIVMPNHFHGILVLREIGNGETRLFASPNQKNANTIGARLMKLTTTGDCNSASPLPAGTIAQSLGSLVGAYKSTCARLINGIRGTPGSPVWQRNYFEHIIRNEDDLRRIRSYIRNNPLRWAEDQENPHKTL
jgi:putative transposase